MQKGDVSRIERAFRKVYCRGEPKEASQGWEERVMSDIRAIDASMDEPSRFMDRIFWRLVPAFCALLFLLTIVNAVTPVIPHEAYSQGLIQDPFVLTLLRMFGL